MSNFMGKYAPKSISAGAEPHAGGAYSAPQTP